nr:SKP1-like protein 21 isoform X1 [Tanacetum cinerariifolium]
NVEIKEEHVDDRYVDDLLLFINSGNKDSKGVKPTKYKKKNRKRKIIRRNLKNGNYKKETDSLSSSHNS